MDHFTLSLCVGAAAGALDVLPKVFQGASARSCFSAFFIFLFSAVIVFHADLPYLPWWADGMGTTLMLSIPVFFTLSGKERTTIPVFVFDALLFALPIRPAERCLSQGRHDRRLRRHDGPHDAADLPPGGPFFSAPHPCSIAARLRIQGKRPAAGGEAEPRPPR